MIPSEHSRIIDRLGGTARVAELCDVRSQAVSKWRREGIPKARIKFLQLLHPEFFEDGGQSACDPVGFNRPEKAVS